MRASVVIACLVAGGAAAPPPVPAEPTPAAVVCAVSGTVSVTAPGRQRRPVHLFDWLRSAAVVEVESGSSVVLAFGNGKRFELGPSARATVGAVDLQSVSGPVQPLPAVPPLPRFARIADSESPGRKVGAIRLRRDEIGVLYPVPPARARAEATELRFTLVRGVARYRVAVDDAAGRRAFEEETASDSVRVPAGTLRPSSRYRWSVRAVAPEGWALAGAAVFETLDEDQARSRALLEQHVAQAGDVPSLLLLAAVDRELGLLAEAREGLKAALGRAQDDGTRRMVAGILARLEGPEEE